MATLRIKLHSDLCAGSGEATGMTVDNDLCIDEYGFPYVPARRIKGVLRKAGEELAQCGAVRQEDVKALFGTSESPGLVRLSDAVLPGLDEMRAYLTLALPQPELERAAAPLNITKLFTSVRGQTRLEDGVAVDGTLRFTRVLNRYNALYPDQETELVGEVVLKPSANAELFRCCCDAVRHIGSDRNRGLGNVRLRYDPDGGKNNSAVTIPETPTEEGAWRIDYTLSLDAPVTLPGCAELLNEIPGRSVIGCLAAQTVSGEEVPADLFLNGKVVWSSLTPRICGQRSIPAPLSLVRLKDRGSYINRTIGSVPVGEKFKAVEDSYFVQTDEGGRVAKTNSHTIYHHSNKSRSLYVQESLDAGMLYSGYVEVPNKDLAGAVLSLLRTARFSFGRSKSAQYGNCTLAESPKVSHITRTEWTLTAGATVWVLLESDLVLCDEQGLYTTDPDAVRAALAKEFKLKNKRPKNKQDYCETRVLSGYQVKWNLPKPQIPAMRGGSVFAFETDMGSCRTVGQLGEFRQEGLGVCRILSEEDMRAFGGIAKAQIDLRTPESGSTGKALERAMAGAELERLFSEEISVLYHEIADAKNNKNREFRAPTPDMSLRTGTLGRIRQMVADAASYDDLMERVGQIKTSDRHSDNTISDREKTEKLVQTAWSRTCGSHSRLVTLCGGDEFRLWKKSMLQLIHLLYYGK